MLDDGINHGQSCHAEIPFMSGRCVSLLYSTKVTEAVVLAGLVAIGLVQSFTPTVCSILGLDQSCQVRLEAVTSAGILVAGAYFGAVLGINWTPKHPRLFSCVAVITIFIITFGRYEIQSVCTGRVDCEVTLMSMSLGLLVYAGAMLGIYYGTKLRRHASA